MQLACDYFIEECQHSSPDTHQVHMTHLLPKAKCHFSSLSFLSRVSFCCLTTAAESLVVEMHLDYN